jgi:hypothetical protein
MEAFAETFSAPGCQRRKITEQPGPSCNKYDAIRLDCATAGDFQTCVKIKMGPNSDEQVEACGGYDIDARISPPLNTPSDFDCFLFRYHIK